MEWLGIGMQLALFTITALDANVDFFNRYLLLCGRLNWLLTVYVTATYLLLSYADCQPKFFSANLLAKLKPKIFQK